MHEMKPPRSQTKNGSIIKFCCPNQSLPPTINLQVWLAGSPYFQFHILLWIQSKSENSLNYHRHLRYTLPRIYRRHHWWHSNLANIANVIRKLINNRCVARWWKTPLGRVVRRPFFAQFRSLLRQSTTGSIRSETLKLSTIEIIIQQWMVYYLVENESAYVSPAICAPVVLRYISTPKHPRALWQTFSFSIATVVADNRRQSWNTSEKWWGEGSKDDDDDGVDDDYRAMNTEDEELVTGLGIDEETRRVTAASSQCRHNAPGWRQSLLGMCGFSVFTSC